MLKILIIGLFIFSTVCSSIKPDIEFDADKKILLCTDENNDYIKIKPANNAITPDKLAYGMYDSDTGERTITLSIDLINEVPEDVLEFVAYHECGHHKLKHFPLDTNRISPKWLKNEKTREYEADCFATTIYIAKHGYSNYIKILKTLRNTRFTTNDRLAKIITCGKHYDI